MEKRELSPRPAVNRSLREFDGNLDPIDVASCTLTCADGVARPGLGLYHGTHHLQTVRGWITPNPRHLAELREAAPLLFALFAVSDYHTVDGLTFGEVALTMSMLAALTGIKSRATLHRTLKKLERMGYVYYKPTSNRLTPAFIRIFSKNAETGESVFNAEGSWRPGFVHGVERGALIRTVSSMESNFLLTAAGTPTPSPVSAERIKMAPIFITDPPMVQNAALASSDDPFLNALDIPGLQDIVCSYRDQLPPELQDLSLDDGQMPDQELMRSIFQDGQEVVFKFNPIESEVDQGASDQQLERGGIRQNDHDTNIVITVCVPSAENAEAPRTDASGAAAAPPPAAPPGAVALLVAPLTERLRRPGRWVAVERQRGPRLTSEARLTLSPRQRPCVEAFERLLGIPFCDGDLKPLEEALHGRSGRFVERAIADCASSPFAFYAVREGMAAITKAVKPGWDAIQAYNSEAVPFRRKPTQSQQNSPWNQS